MNTPKTFEHRLWNDDDVKVPWFCDPMPLTSLPLSSMDCTTYYAQLTIWDILHPLKRISEIFETYSLNAAGF